MPLILCLLCWIGVWLLGKYELWEAGQRKKEYIKKMNDMGIGYYFDKYDKK